MRKLKVLRDVQMNFRMTPDTSAKFRKIVDFYRSCPHDSDEPVSITGTYVIENMIDREYERLGLCEKR